MSPEAIVASAAAIVGPVAVMVFMKRWLDALQAAWEQKFKTLQDTVEKLEKTLDGQRRASDSLGIQLVRDFATKLDVKWLADRTTDQEARIRVLEDRAGIASPRGGQTQ